MQTGDVVQERAQTLLKEFADSVQNKEIIDGLHVSTNNDGKPLILTGGSAYKLNHKLNRKPLGCHVTSQNAHGSVITTASDDKTITLTSDNTMTVSLWIF